MDRFAEGWRAAGLMVHPTALPNNFGVGDFGPAAYRLIDLLKKTGLTFWQVLPVTPTGSALGHSPYSAYSAFAGHELLISPELLAQNYYLTEAEAADFQLPLTSEVNFEKVIIRKKALLDLCFGRVHKTLLDQEDFLIFAREHGVWLNDYAFFMAAKDDFNGRPWNEWPPELAHREDYALAKHGARLAKPILRHKFGQFLFFRQLTDLKKAFNEAGLALIGDVAFYVNHDSSDVWANQNLFALNERGETAIMAGVPPDYYAKNGQLWGNPVYDWPAHVNSDFGWWKYRLNHWLHFFDWTRLDHFRALAAFWGTLAGSPTAATGSWLPSPGWDLLRQLVGGGGPLNIIAEDLGVITPDVTTLRKAFQLPGTRVLQFGFGPDQPLSLHAPFRIEPDNVVYPGTHDNNTTRGWYCQELTASDRQRVSDLAGYRVSEANVAFALTRLAWLSPGAIAITNLPDLLNLDEKSRFNLTGEAKGT
ncbi:MAG: 4-alpha-glucanotransferase, partial [Deltaproteobacteria bacterium]|nr:4-alpha-glucanotransferase [Deltaproteobacteria bacterium]